MPDLLINGVAARAAFGFVMAECAGWLDAPSQTRQTAVIPGRAGAIALADPQEQPRKLTLRGTILGLSASDARAKMDALKAAMFATPLTLSFPDQPTRQVYAGVDSWPVTPPPVSTYAKMLAIEIGLTLNDPYSYDTAFTPVTGTGHHALPLGTGTVRPLITMAGPVSGPVTFGYYAHGVLTQQMVMSLNLVSGDTLAIDCDAMTVEINNVNTISSLAAGDFFVFDPTRDGDAVTGWPYLTASPDAAFSVAYRKAWR